MANNYYKPKVWNAYCDSCGFKFKSDQLKLRWDGLMVDDACWEPRQPQDFLRAVKETSNTLPWTRPQDGSDESTESPLYVDYNYWDGGTDPIPPAPPGSIVPPPPPLAVPGYVQPGSEPPTVIPAVNVAPTVTDPSNASVTEGDGVTFGPVTFTGTPTPGLQWYRNGVAIPGAIQPFYYITTTTIAEDGDTFYVVATNVAGTDQSTTATLTVTAVSTWNPLDKGPGITLSSGNLVATCTTALSSVRGTLGRAQADGGIWQIEFNTWGGTADKEHVFGLSRPEASLLYYPGGDVYGWGYLPSGTGYLVNGGLTAAATCNYGDVIGVVWDTSAQTIKWYANGVLKGTFNSIGTAFTLYPAWGPDTAGGTRWITLNTGATPFSYPIVGATAWDS